MSTSTVALPKTLVELAVACQFDPLQYVCCAYTWGEGLLEEEDGPDVWQVEVLEYLKDALLDPAHTGAIRIGVASGHGIGKGALSAWIIQWYMSCRARPQIVVTANTQAQLLTKTWRELAKWHSLSLFRPWFQWTKTAYFKRGAEESWFAAAIPWNESKAEAFQGAHDKYVLILEDEACHDDQTEVLTNEGWKFFADLGGHELLLTMDPDTHQAMYVKPAKLFRAYRDGEMLLYQRRGADFCVTPHHRMWHQGWQGRRQQWGSWRFTPAQALTKTQSRLARWVDWSVEEQAFFSLPAYQGRRVGWVARQLPMDAWMAWLGWYCSEGWLGSFRQGDPYSVCIGNTNPEAIADICALSQALGFSPRLSTKGDCPTVWINHRPLAHWLMQWGRYSHEKHVPTVVRMASARQIRLFLERYRAGDGYGRTAERSILYTSSPRMAGDLQECILKAGGISTVRLRALVGRPAQFDDHVGVSAYDGFVVSWQEARSAVLFRQQHLQRIPYQGYVYCAEVPPSHLLLTRRNGYVLWSGNSAIPDTIHDTIEGSMTTPQALWLKFGNPTRNTGRFKEIFPGGRLAHRWWTRQIDSRTCKKADQGQIAQWIHDYGEDSDFVRVRVRGEFPRAGSTQFIGDDLIQLAKTRERVDDQTAPIVIGVDVARFGDDRSVILVRQGPQILEKLIYREKNTVEVAGYVGEAIYEYKPQAVFIDVVGIGAGVYDQLVGLGHRRIFEVQAGAAALDPTHYANKRAEMWDGMRAWLESRGQLDPMDFVLPAELTGIEYGYDIRQRLLLEKKEDMKRRGLASPDEADALSLTFAQYVPPVKRPARPEPEELLWPSERGGSRLGWMG